MEQGNFELVTQKVEGFVAHCLPSGPNICELALFRIVLQALKSTHTALAGGLGFSHFSQPSKPSTIMSHSSCSPNHGLPLCQHPKSTAWTVACHVSACHLVSLAPLQYLSCFLFMSWGKSGQNLLSVPHVLGDSSLWHRHCCSLQFGFGPSLPQPCFVYVWFYPTVSLFLQVHPCSGWTI